MSSTKKLAICATLAATGVALLSLGAIFEVADLAVSCIASLFVVMIYIEVVSPYTWLLWICTSLSAALMFPGSIVWLEYLLVFGVYPLIKGCVERLRRPLWLPIKLAYINSIVWALFFVFDLVFSLDFFGTESLPMRAAVYILINVAFLAYDKFITVMTRLYFLKYRQMFKRFFK